MTTNHSPLKYKKSRAIHHISVLFLLFFLPIQGAAALIPPEGPAGGSLPATVLLDDIWFYDDENQKVIPRIDPDWMTVVFKSRAIASLPQGQKNPLQGLAGELANRHGDIVDWFFDGDLATDACFFKLRQGIPPKALGALIPVLNKIPRVRYAHPVIELNNRRYAFFDTIDIEWKTGIAPHVKERVAALAHVSMDGDKGPYRVDLNRIPLFKAVNLLAEDIHIRRAAPRFIEVVPTIIATLSLALNGGNTGDKIPFVFRVDFSDRVTIDASAIANIDMRPSGIQKELYDVHIDPYDYVETATRTPIRITGWLKIFTPGDFIIPPVDIRYTCTGCPDGQARITESNTAAIKISSIIPHRQEAGNLIIPSDHPKPAGDPEDYRARAMHHLWGAAGAFLTAILAIGWLLILAYRAGQQKKQPPVKSKSDILEEKLRVFLEKPPARPHWSHVAQLNHIFREYLVSTYHPAAKGDGGSGTVFFKTMAKRIPAGIREDLQHVLSTFDAIVAKEVDTYADMHGITSDVLNIIDSGKT